MKRNTRAEKAQETLQIIAAGCYETGNSTVFIRDNISRSLAATELYAPDGFDAVLATVHDLLSEAACNTIIKVRNTTVLEAASELNQTATGIGCLNFASAKNPGGGFLGGAMAQEESLALSSALYATLMKHFEMYEYNRKRHTYLYSDYMIYSPEVMVFRNDDGDLLPTPYPVTFVTSPAVNVGAMKNNNPQELLQVEATMMQRMDKVLALFVYHGIKHLLLGAWGCGVFQNEPANIATYFSRMLLNGGKYSHAFESVTFAVYDKSKDGNNIAAFQHLFGRR